MSLSEGSHSKTLYILMTSLFYPAVLGAIFYSILETSAKLNSQKDVTLLILAYFGILISFSVDFLYTFAARKYPALLFISDMIVLLLLFLGYSSLITALSQPISPKPFLLCYTLIHLIFCIWDLLLIPREDRVTLIVAYDVSGFLLSLLGYIFFADSKWTALIVLWMLTPFYCVVALKAIVPQLKDSTSA